MSVMRVSYVSDAPPGDRVWLGCEKKTTRKYLQLFSAASCDVKYVEGVMKKNLDFPPVSRFVSETVRDRAIGAIERCPAGDTGDNPPKI